MQQARKAVVFHRQENFDQADHRSAGGGMADMRFGTAHGTVVLPIGKAAEGADQGIGLDRIAQPGAGAVGLDVADLCGDRCRSAGIQSRSALPGQSIGGGNAVAGTVLVHARATNHAVDGITVGDSIRKPFQDDDAHPLREDRAVGEASKG